MPTSLGDFRNLKSSVHTRSFSTSQAMFEKRCALVYLLVQEMSPENFMLVDPLGRKLQPIF